jgi:hypothetical protein
MNPEDFVGRWGYGAYARDQDRARTEAAARNSCSKPVVIARGPSGGLMMPVADVREPQEVQLKQGSDGKVYLGPEGPAPDQRDREIIAFDGRVIVMRYVDPEVATRYGNALYVRCGAPGTVASKRKGE